MREWIGIHKVTMKVGELLYIHIVHPQESVISSSSADLFCVDATALELAAISILIRQRLDAKTPFSPHVRRHMLQGLGSRLYKSVHPATSVSAFSLVILAIILRQTLPSIVRMVPFLRLL